MIRKILDRAGHMCDLAYFVQKLTGLTAMMLLIGSLLCFLSVEEVNEDTYSRLLMARELFRTASGILLTGVIAAVCIEDIHGDAV